MVNQCQPALTITTPYPALLTTIQPSGFVGHLQTAVKALFLKSLDMDRIWIESNQRNMRILFDNQLSL